MNSNQPTKKKIKDSTAYDIHSILDYMLVECAVSNVSMGKRLSIPYKNVLCEGQDPKYAESHLEVEIKVIWNAKLTKAPADTPEPDKGNPQ